MVRLLAVSQSVATVRRSSGCRYVLPLITSHVATSPQTVACRFGASSSNKLAIQPHTQSKRQTLLIQVQIRYNRQQTSIPCITSVFITRCAVSADLPAIRCPVATICLCRWCFLFCAAIQMPSSSLRMTIGRPTQPFLLQQPTTPSRHPRRAYPLLLLHPHGPERHQLQQLPL